MMAVLQVVEQMGESRERPQASPHDRLCQDVRRRRHAEYRSIQSRSASLESPALGSSAVE